MKRIFIGVATIVAFVAIDSRGAEVIPPKPAVYFNDYAGVVSKDAAHRFNEQLAQFERETSNQVVSGPLKLGELGRKAQITALSCSCSSKIGGCEFSQVMV